VSEDVYIGAQISREDLSVFLVEVCKLLPEETVGIETWTYSCEDFVCYLDQASKLARVLIEERFGFVPSFCLGFLIKNVPFHDSYRRLIETIQLLFLQYQLDCVWLTNGEFPQLVKFGGRLTIQGGHSKYSQWADYLKRIPDDIGLPYEVEAMPVV